MTTRVVPQAPPPLTVATALAGLEALGLVVLAVVEIATLTGERATMGITTTAFFLLYGVGLAWCAWSLQHLHGWARSPLVLAQLIQLGVAWSFRGGETTWVAVCLAIVAFVVLAGVFSPASLDALSEEPAEDPAEDPAGVADAEEPDDRP